MAGFSKLGTLLAWAVARTRKGNLDKQRNETHRIMATFTAPVSSPQNYADYTYTTRFLLVNTLKDLIPKEESN